MNNTFTQLVPWVIAHGYFFFYIAAVLEGPIVTAAAGVAAAMGFFSIWIIMFLAILGDLTADAFFYSVGYFGGYPLIEKYSKYIGLTPERATKIKSLLHEHITKTLVLIKVSPIIPVPGILLVGSLRVSFRKFMNSSLMITVPKASLFALIGFSLGKTYTHFSGAVANSPYILFGIVVVLLLIYTIYQKITLRISRDIE